MPDEVIRLSPSIAKTLLQRSPLHAFDEHRLLGGNRKGATKVMDEGKLIENILCDLPADDLELLDFDNFMSKAAKEAKATALLAGKTPILMRSYMEASTSAEAMRPHLNAKGINLLDGLKQQRLEWQSQGGGFGGPGVACSGVPDILILDEAKRICICRDLKTTDNAHPRTLQRKAVDMGWDIQEAAYTEAINTLYPWTAGIVEFQFVVVERSTPFACTIAELSGEMREMGQRKWRRAVDTWGRCLATKRWPDYSPIPVRLEAIPWQLTQEAEQELDTQEAQP